MSNIEFVTRKQGELYKVNQDRHDTYAAFDVSSYAKSPFNRLSPYTYSFRFKIPVPGMKQKHAHSVEGIWQGLKVINGSIDESLFCDRPKKRKGNVEGHKFGEGILGIQLAREHIYLPSYEYYINKYAPKEAISEILNEQRQGKQVYLYDVEGNGNIENQAPLAHAAVLATLLNLTIFSKKLKPKNDAEKAVFKILDRGCPTSEKLAEIISLFPNTDVEQAVTYRCIEHPTSLSDYLVGTTLNTLT